MAGEPVQNTGSISVSMARGFPADVGLPAQSAASVERYEFSVYELHWTVTKQSVLTRPQHDRKGGDQVGAVGHLLTRRTRMACKSRQRLDLWQRG